MTSTVESHQRGWACHRSRSWRVYQRGSAARSLLPSAAAKQDSSPAMASLYQGRAERAFAAGDYRTARLCFERLALEDGRPEFIYALSRSCWALGEKERAAALLAKIAPAAGGARRHPRSPVASPTPAVRRQAIGVVETNRTRPLAVRSGRRSGFTRSTRPPRRASSGSGPPG